MNARLDTRRTGMLLTAVCLAMTAAAVPASTGQLWSERVEADWLLAEKAAAQGGVSEQVTTRNDAVGGCDGIKTGEWGFHTGENNGPWWQVDLGAARELGRVVVWNRMSAVARAARINVQLSGDGQQFRVVYQHDGTAFGGVGDNKPLVV
ncbi:MAG: discoidin domain-containing protein, partial [Opitutaceae bacterium]|nr:discoidin domain-containing protein [Opitutaceae bacterium]